MTSSDSLAASPFASSSSSLTSSAMSSLLPTSSATASAASGSLLSTSIAAPAAAASSSSPWPAAPDGLSLSSGLFASQAAFPPFSGFTFGSSLSSASSTAAAVTGWHSASSPSAAASGAVFTPAFPSSSSISSVGAMPTGSPSFASLFSSPSLSPFSAGKAAFTASGSSPFSSSAAAQPALWPSASTSTPPPAPPVAFPPTAAVQSAAVSEPRTATEVSSSLQPYQATCTSDRQNEEPTVFHCLTAMPAYSQHSLDELRWQDTQRADAAAQSPVNSPPARVLATTEDMVRECTNAALQNLLPGLIELLVNSGVPLPVAQQRVFGDLLRQHEERCASLTAQLADEKRLTQQLLGQLDLQPEAQAAAATADTDTVLALQQRFLLALEAEEKAERGASGGLITIEQLEGAVSQLQAVIQARQHKQRREAADKWDCKVCYEQKIDVQLLPCHHLCCSSCAAKLDKCPLCRKQIRLRSMLMLG